MKINISKACNWFNLLAIATLLVVSGCKKEEQKEVAKPKQAQTEKQQCEAGNFKICLKLGRAYLDGGSSVSRNLDQAQHYLELSCNSGDATGCYHLGRVHTLFRNEHGYEQALSLFNKSCKRQEMDACVALGNLYYNGQGTRRDDNSAKELFQKACDVKNMNGCYHLGILNEKGHGLPRNYENAKRIYEEVCESGEGSGCNALGLLYQHGQGVPKDFEMAKKYYDLACNKKNTLGCYNAGFMYYNGIGAENPDEETAKKYFNLGCKLEGKKHCNIQDKI